MNELSDVFKRAKERGSMPDPASSDWRERRDARLVNDIIDERDQSKWLGKS